MNSDNVIEAFVTTIIVLVVIVTLSQLYYPSVGEVLINALPAFVEIIIYAFLFIFVGNLIFQLID